MAEDSPRTPLTRERVLRAAISLTDENGIESLSMRKLGHELGVEAMSLYNHVANKDDLVNGIVEMVVSKFALPPDKADWKAALRHTARSVRDVLLRHPWAATLIESRVTASRVRFRYSDAVIGALRRAGFSIELAYRAQLTISSYIYGFTLQEVSWPFDPEERHDVAATLQPRVAADEHPNLTEMMGWIMQTQVPNAAANGTRAYESDFEYGLDLILDGLERVRRA
jgi:AcrR family transcriptional regulator